MKWKRQVILIGIAIFILIIALISAVTWQSALLFQFDDDDGAPATYTTEILDGGSAKPNFAGTLTEIAIMVDVTLGKSVDANEGTNFYHCETSDCTGGLLIGGLSGTSLNTEGIFWVNSTESTLLARFEHNGVDAEFLKGNETADPLDGGEDLSYDAYFWLIWTDTQAPQWSSNSTNSTSAGQTVSHNVFWTDNVGFSGYIFSFDNGNGTFYNDTWSAMDSSNWTNISKVANSTVDSTVRWRVYVNDSSNNLNVTSNFQNTTTIVTDSCTCTDGASWTIINGDQCTLSTTCNLGNNRFRILDGALRIDSTGSLNAQGCYIQSTESLYVISGGKLTCR